MMTFWVTHIVLRKHRIKIWNNIFREAININDTGNDATKSIKDVAGWRRVTHITIKIVFKNLGKIFQVYKQLINFF